MPRVVVASNAEAARQAAEDPSVAAIAGEMAADRYKLRMLSTRIEDHPDNKTRFLVLGNQNVGPSGKDKTVDISFCPQRTWRIVACTRALPAL